jgi:hypothetical protein
MPNSPVPPAETGFDNCRSKPICGKNRAYLPGIPNLSARTLIMLTIFCADRRVGRAALALATAGLIAAAEPAAAAEMLNLRCTNPVGGATWSVAVDLDHQLVDSRPAEISDSLIKWRDEHGGIYELERATGKLQLRAASTTGGYFLHYTCRPE